MNIKWLYIKTINRVQQMMLIIKKIILIYLIHLENIRFI